MSGYQQVDTNEKAMYDATPPPPPYYTTNANAPLLPPPATAATATTTTVIVGKREGTSCCGVVCSVTAIIISCIVCCCCFAGLVVGILFGVWAAACSNLDYQLTVEHQGNLDGVGQKTIEIRNFGTLELNPVSTGTLGIRTSSELKADSYDDALDASYTFEVDPTTFSLEFNSYLWSCSEQDVTAELLDRASLSPVALSLDNFSGDMTVGSFLAVSFSEVELISRSGLVTFGYLNVTDKLSVESMSGGISSMSGAVAGRKISLESMSGTIVATSLTSLEVKIESMSGDVTIGDLVLSGTGECEVEVEARSGDVEIAAIRLLSTSPCELKLETLSGDSRVNIYGFSGTYSIASYGGEAVLNGVSCARNSCDGVVPGGFHTLEVRAYSGDAIVALL